MATLALSLAGQFAGALVGGPIGATVGRALGAEVTRTLHDDGIEWRFAIPNEALDPARDPHGETELEKPGSAGAPAPATAPSAEK